MTNYNFSLKTFASQSFEEGPEKWAEIKFDSLAPNEQDIITSFFSQATGVTPVFDEEGNVTYAGFEINWNAVLLGIRGDNGGLLEKIVDAQLCKTEEGGLQIKLGNNVFPVKIVKTKRTIDEIELDEYVLKCGKLVCQGLNFASGNAKKVKCKIGGKDTEIDFISCDVKFSAGGNTYDVALRLNFDCESSDLAPTQSNLQAAWAEGKLADFLSVPSEGSNAITMAKLGLGEYKVIGYEEKSGKYGANYILELADGRKVWSAGNIGAQMGDLVTVRPMIDNALATQKFVTLVVSKIEEKGGKNYVTAALLLRAPKVAVAA